MPVYAIYNIMLILITQAGQTLKSIESRAALSLVQLELLALFFLEDKFVWGRVSYTLVNFLFLINYKTGFGLKSLH